jgi:tRNA (cytidine/uridine-2'-O-)-methyltransferase
MDYISQAQVHRHEDWEAFLQWQEREGGRLVLLTPHGTSSYLHMTFQPEDILLLGQESEGVPHEVEKVCDVTVAIPMLPTVRSLNVAVAGAMVLGEALRQTHQMPPFQKEI